VLRTVPLERAISPEDTLRRLAPERRKQAQTAD